MAVTPLRDGVHMSEHIFDTDELAWSEDGRCATADPELFFPRRGADTSAARSLCRACPVRDECLDYALETRQKFGIWGGMTEGQRRRLRRSAVPESAAGQVMDRSDADDPTRPVRHLRLVH
jgi:WhiB family redox-sensing transcriptional regulator